jgi:hypothetical protein
MVALGDEVGIPNLSELIERALPRLRVVSVSEWDTLRSEYVRVLSTRPLLT